MNTILKPLLGKSMLVHLDDIIKMASTFEEHLRLLKEVFTLLRNAELTVKFENLNILKNKLISWV